MGFLSLVGFWFFLEDVNVPSFSGKKSLQNLNSRKDISEIEHIFDGGRVGGNRQL